jgi:hypothetical protein
MKRSPSLALFALLSACARIAPGPVTVADALLQAVPDPVRVPGALGTVEQHGFQVTLAISHRCDITEKRTVRRTTEQRFVNETPARDWIFGISGGALLVAGGVFFIDSGNVAAQDRASMDYNPVGPALPRTVGIGLLAVGAALASIATVDIVRANTRVADTKTVTVDGKIDRGVACPESPFPSAAITARYQGRSFDLGTTDPRGRLELDLDAALPQDAGLVRGEPFLFLDVEGVELARIEVLAVVAHREERTWTTLPRAACRDPQKASDCDPVKAFLSAYGEGPHAGEARELLASAEPRLRRLADEETWRTADVSACVNGKPRKDGSESCDGVRKYLKTFPDGRHRVEAELILHKSHGERRAPQPGEGPREGPVGGPITDRDRRNVESSRAKCLAWCQIQCGSWQSDVIKCVSSCTQRGCK